MREFSFALPGDIYVRYQSFKGISQMEQSIKKKCPDKIDIGAIFTHPPSMKNTVSPNAFVPIEKELVFDIDLTDYDEVRTCCSEANICPKCWRFATIAIQVMDRVLKSDFGFKHILWVYSGRRGIHCWVCDKRARKLTNEGRSAVASYLQIMSGGGEGSKRTFHNVDHPTTKQLADEILEPYFLNYILPEQGWLKPEYRGKLLECVPTDISESIRAIIEDSSLSPKVAWEEIKEICNKEGARWEVKQTPMRILAVFTYPRLDINVSKQLHHLLKSPFVVHPKTGRVCVPIDPEECEKFDPFTVPTVAQLLQEIDTQNIPPDKVFTDTSMRTPIETFERFLGPLEDDLRMNRMQSATKKLRRHNKGKDAVTPMDIEENPF